MKKSYLIPLAAATLLSSMSCAFAVTKYTYAYPGNAVAKINQAIAKELSVGANNVQVKYFDASLSGFMTNMDYKGDASGLKFITANEETESATLNYIVDGAWTCSNGGETKTGKVQAKVTFGLKDGSATIDVGSLKNGCSVATQNLFMRGNRVGAALEAQQPTAGIRLEGLLVTRAQVQDA